MTKRSTALQAGACLFFLLILLASCRKERVPVKEPFKASIKTWYRISPTAPVSVIVSGKTYSGFAHFPGGGTGTSTHMDNVTNWFNQLAYTTPPNTDPEGSVGAPVADVPLYPVLGAPLPLIQAGNFTALSPTLSALSVPADIEGNVINSIIYNDKGDAVFTSAITGTGGTFPLPDSKVGFNGKALIVGGRGKLAGATGQIDFKGYFNIADPNDAEYEAEGWISY